MNTTNEPTVPNSPRDLYIRRKLAQAYEEVDRLRADVARLTARVRELEGLPPT